MMVYGCGLKAKQNSQNGKNKMIANQWLMNMSKDRLNSKIA